MLLNKKITMPDVSWFFVWSQLVIFMLRGWKGEIKGDYILCARFINYTEGQKNLGETESTVRIRSRGQSTKMTDSI